MSRFSVEVTISNDADLVMAQAGYIAKDKVRSARVRGIVDSGAAKLVLPKALVEQLGLPRIGKIKVKYADGRVATRDFVSSVRVEIQGRVSVFAAVVEPKRTDVLIGALVLEDFDFLVDCLHEKLVPRDPRYILSEIE